MIAEGTRVRQAREFCGLTQTEFARRVGVSQPAIAQIEAGRTQPSRAVLEAIAFQTGFSISFFRRGVFENFPLGSLVFRAKKAMTAKQRDQVYRYGEVLYEAVSRMAERLELGPIRLPRLARGGFDSPAHAATLTRIAFGLSPDTPIPNLMNAVERAGVLVLPLPIRFDRADAYSLWAEDRPVIVIFQGIPGDRLRMNVAHEIGHLVMHQQLPADERQGEQEAFGFAGELLMPEPAARAELVPPITLSHLAPLKPRWGIAIAALIMRATRLGLVTPRQQKYLFQQLSQRGWRTREPPNLDVPVEKPRAVRKIVELLYGDPPDLRRVAGDLGLPLAFVRDVVSDGATLADLPRLGPVAAPVDESSSTVEPPDNLFDLAARRLRSQADEFDA